MPDEPVSAMRRVASGAESIFGSRIANTVAQLGAVGLIYVLLSNSISYIQESNDKQAEYAEKQRQDMQDRAERQRQEMRLDAKEAAEKNRERMKAQSAALHEMAVELGELRWELSKTRATKSASKTFVQPTSKRIDGVIKATSKGMK